MLYCACSSPGAPCHIVSDMWGIRVAFIWTNYIQIPVLIKMLCVKAQSVWRLTGNIGDVCNHCSSCKKKNFFAKVLSNVQELIIPQIVIFKVINKKGV